VNLARLIEPVYQQFAGYPCPRELWVCPVCGPEWSAAQICSTPLRSVSSSQLSAVHVMSLDDDGLRYFLPRLVELLLVEPSPWFDFRLSDLKGRSPAWRPAESAAVRDFVVAVWRGLLGTYPPSRSYLGDCPSMLSFIDWCDIPLAPFLDEWQSTDALPAARHLADLVNYVFATRKPFESDIKATVLSWLRQPAIGERLQDAFFAADGEEAASQLSAAYELWVVCIRG
jgi:hypothetical protein